MENPYDLFAVVYAGLAGLLVSSFLNVAVYRLPHGETIVQGHSHCMSCGHALGAADLVPVFSYLLLGRRCRYCRAPISGRYMTVELAGGIFFTLAALGNRPFNGPFPVVSLLLLCSLFCLLLVDSLIRFDGHERTFPAMVTALFAVAALFAALPAMRGPNGLAGAAGLTGLAGVAGLTGLTGVAVRLVLFGIGLLVVPLVRRLASSAQDGNALPALPPVHALPAAGLCLSLPGLLAVLLPTLAVLLAAAFPGRAGISAPIAAWCRRSAPLVGVALFAVSVLALA